MLIDSLIEYKKRKGHDITVVFDGWKTGEGREMQSVVSSVKVIYSRIGDTADSVIKRIITSERRQWIVITSDRDIAHHAWASGSVPLPAEDFMRIFQKEQSSNAEEEKEEVDEEHLKNLRKGNPKRLSKKDKAINRALSKL
jgi:hypothetical protein